jgi:6-pyruvoyltetrahydropterin/6-carboxytetrahydropterin synthase
MFTISIKTSFSAAHSIKGYEGNCAELHGHNYTVEVNVKAERVNSMGMCVDFRKLRETAEKVIGTLDHTNLNAIPFFKEKNPTAENIAHFIYKKVQQELKGDYTLDSITVWETERYAVTYSE